MKIGIYSPYLDTLTGGEKYILTAAKCLSSKHEVFLFWDGNEEKHRAEIQRKFNLSLDKVEFTRNIFSKNTSFLSRFWQSRLFDRILVLSDGSIPLVWPPLCLHFQSPMEWIDTNSLKTRLKLQRVKRVICNSLYTKKYIDKKFHVNSIVIYPPVERKKMMDKKKDNIILNIGRFGIRAAGSSYKKQEVLIDVFKRMVNAGLKKWKLILIVSIFESDEKRLKEIQNTIKDYPIEIIQSPNSNVLWQYMQKAKIYWHASGFGEDLEKHPDRAEHFGISTAEAMGMGAVPVVINAGGQKEIVKDDENGFLWNSEEELQEKTNEVISDEALFFRLQKQAQKDVEKFNTQRFCEEIYKTLV